MAKLFEGNLMQSYNKLYELDNYMFIGGLVHDKQSLVPHFNKWGGLLSDNYQSIYMTLDRTMAVRNYLYRFAHNKSFKKNMSLKHYWRSIYDNNKIYFIPNRNANGWLAVIDENNGIYNIDSRQIISSSGLINGLILGEDLDYLYIYYSSNTSYPRAGRFVKINKHTFSLIYNGNLESNYTYVFPIALNQNNGQIFFTRIYNTYQGYIQIGYWDSNVNQFTYLLTIRPSSSATPYIFSFPSDFVEVTSGVYEFYYPSYIPNTGLQIDKVTVDILNANATSTQLTLDYGGLTPTVEIPLENANYYTFELFEYTNGTDNYLILTKYIKGFSASGVEFAFYLFKYDNATGNWMYVGKTILNDVSNPNFVMNITSDNKVFVVGYNNYYRYYMLDDVNDTMILVDEVAGSYELIGKDELGRVFILDSNSNIYMESISLPYRVDVRLAQTSYTWTGTNINTQAILNVYNYLNQRIATNVNLKLLGNIEFTDGTKEKVITTSATGDTLIDVVITGAGHVELIPSIVL